jgi:hypothetical protein
MFKVLGGNWSRRRFVHVAGSFAALNLTQSQGMLAAAGPKGVSIVLDANDPLVREPAAQWAAQELKRVLTEKNVKVTRCTTIADVPGGETCIVASSPDASIARGLLRDAGVTVDPALESLGILSGRLGSRAVTLACGRGVRGIVYALLELADRVDCSGNAFSALEVTEPLLEKPANRVRSSNRCFQSDVEDKAWFQDREMWQSYLTMLASSRFNRFNLSLGLGYDYPQTTSDTYLYFTYPFLINVPGYNVRAVPLADRERDENLETIKFISDQAALRGLDFQLGLWNHAYVMPKGSKPTYNIEGLTADNHAAYCRDALYALLKACLGITGITLRVHGESGIPEGNFDFWEVVFQGIGRLDRKIEVNLHAKGTSERMFEIAAKTGMPVTLSPKYWAEHLGLPYQPSSIRETEMPPKEPTKAGSLFELSSGARRFLRYSFGDLFKKKRRYEVYFRIWPGTQRVLLWGDPALAAADGRAMTISTSLGVDLFEPLSYKGRGGSGIAGGRCGYADPTLTPRYDWQKFLYSYRVWGRHIYNPSADPAACERYWKKQLGVGGVAMTQALASASRVLRIVTTAHDPSAANWTYWTEMYTNMPIVEESMNTLYRDTPAPKVFGNVSSLDPQMFSSIAESVSGLLAGKENGRYTSMEVSGWIEKYSARAGKKLAEARSLSRNTSSPEFRRAAVDIAIQSNLGEFFCWKIRSALFYGVFDQTGSRKALEQALAAYRKARGFWSGAAEAAGAVYMADITYGPPKHMRGNWTDRIAAIDADIDAMQAKLSALAEGNSLRPGFTGEQIETVLRGLNSPAIRFDAECDHTPARSFKPGTAHMIELGARNGFAAVRLNYRHVNQGENYRTVAMEMREQAYRAMIPEEYTESEFDLQYYFELDGGKRGMTMYPGLGPDLTGQPYFVVQQA